jgi:hypothetical protein
MFPLSNPGMSNRHDSCAISLSSQHCSTHMIALICIDGLCLDYVWWYGHCCQQFPQSHCHIMCDIWQLITPLYSANMQIVWGVRSGSEVDRHGVLHLGDTITAVGQHPVRREENLLAILESFNLGEVVDMTLQQDRYTRTVKVELLFDRLDPSLTPCG